MVSRRTRTPARRPLALVLRALMACSAHAATDLHENCQAWAESGECELNDAYMLANCAKSCESKKGYVSQIKKECIGYAKQGECSRNPAFMLSTCRAECDAWEKENNVRLATCMHAVIATLRLSQLWPLRTRAPPASQLRIDRDSRCVEWSLLGQCVKEPARMAKTCNTSCTVHEHCARSNYTGWSVGICDKALRCEPKDKRSDCATRAARGDCAAKPTQMAVDCLSSCAKADIDSVLSAQKPEMRARLSPLYDVSRAATRAHDRCWMPGWSGHNHYKLHLPTMCAAPRTLPWHRTGRRRVHRERREASADEAVTCPVDVGMTTPRVAWASGRRNVTIPPHTNHVVQVHQVLQSPRVRLLREFLTADEAEEILRISQPLFHRSPVRSVATDRRTSSTATLGGTIFGQGANWAVKRIRERISAFSGYGDHMLEPLQVVRYHPGEKYEAHHDLFDLCDFPQVWAQARLRARAVAGVEQRVPWPRALATRARPLMHA